MSKSPYKSTSVKMKKTETIAIPSRYDFTIHVGEDYRGQPLCSFRVARSSMTTSSDVWAFDLESAHERGEDNFWYRADSPEAFRIILNIIHGRPSANPKSVTQAVLHQVAKSAARYRVVGELQDFIGSREKLLNKGIPHTANRYARSTNFEQRIETSVVFQQFKSFDKALTEVVRTTDLGIVSQVIVHPKSRRIMARSAPNQSAGKSVIRVNLPGQDHSIFSSEVEMQAGMRKAELDAEVNRFLLEAESGLANHCTVRTSKTANKCRNSIVGSIRCGMTVYEHNEFTLEKYAQHLRSIEITPSHAAHQRCVDALDWEGRITRIYERKFGWSGAILSQFPDVKMRKKKPRYMISSTYGSRDFDDNRDFEELDDSN
ncbi:hypothetical protein FKW77_008974 [Venturia effusa]|uniref:Uncharacterized protein n=1 Tax=Venturia effusa TaxID=50376 RepID=A0A517LEH1_9PEZI|nr:hypothetical protein FKW77_008974 [Venturia effusa]